VVVGEGGLDSVDLPEGGGLPQIGSGASFDESPGRVPLPSASKGSTASMPSDQARASSSACMPCSVWGVPAGCTFLARVIGLGLGAAATVSVRYVPRPGTVISHTDIVHSGARAWAASGGLAPYR
jgi:hypothetical protein